MRPLFAGVLGATAIACTEPADLPGGEQHDQELSAINGLRLNGLRLNGLRLNGLRLNGLRLNGLRLNGLRLNGMAASPDFATWFNGAEGGGPAAHADFMKYLLGCALPPDKSATFTDAGDITYTWHGWLGLAPGWWDGSSPVTEEQDQFISACIASHVNTAEPNPKHVQISIRGGHPSLAVGAAEGGALAWYDGTFFGNAFGGTEADPTDLYVCGVAATSYNSRLASTVLRDWGRECFMTTDGCKGLFTVVDCSSVCDVATNTAGGLFYGPNCRMNGKSYKAISVAVPKVIEAAKFTLSGASRTTVSGSFSPQVIGGMSTTATAKLTPVQTAANYLLKIRYNNATSSNQFLTVKVGTTTIMNGTSNKWTFTPTGAGLWDWVSIPMYIPANAQVTLQGAGATGLRIDAAAVEVPL